MSNVGDTIKGAAAIGLSFLVAPIPVVGGALAVGLIGYGTGKLTTGLFGTGADSRAGVEARIQGTKHTVRSTQANIPVIYGKTRAGLKVVDTRVVTTLDVATPLADPSSLFTEADQDDVLCRVGAFAVGSENGSGIQGITNIRVYNDGVDVVTGALSFSGAPASGGVAAPYNSVMKYILEDGDDAQNTRTELENALGWDTNVNGVGVAYGAFFFMHNPEVWTKGVPQITAEITGNRVYDPRTSTWIGWAASGASSDNPALCILDYLTSKRYGGGVPYAARDGGGGLDFIDEQSFIDAANYCDDLVTIPGATTEKRFRFNGAVPTSRVVGSNLAEMLTTCRGELIWEQGVYRIVIGQAVAAETYELTEDQIIGEIQWTRRGASVPNSIEGTFPLEGDNGDYVPESVVWPLTGDTTFLDEDNGMENRVEVALPYCTTYYQALRTIMVSLREQRNDVLCNIVADQAAYQLQVGDRVLVTHDGPGWVQQDFIVRQMALLHDGRVGLSLQQYTAGAYSLDTLDAQPSTPTFNLPDPQKQGVSLDFIYERTQAADVSVGFQTWRRELSWANGKQVGSVHVYIPEHTIPSNPPGGAGTLVRREEYFVNVDPTTAPTTLEFIKDITGSTTYEIDGTGFADVDGYVNLDNTNNGVAQEKTFSGSTSEFQFFAIELRRVGVPAGDVQAHIYSDSGGLPGTKLYSSYAMPAMRVLTTDNDTVIFAFPAGTRPSAGAHIGVEYSGGTATDYLQVGVDTGGGTVSGASSILNGSWAANGVVDIPHGTTNFIWDTSSVNQRDRRFSVSYNEGVVTDDGNLPNGIQLTPYPEAGGRATRSAPGATVEVTTKAILEYDDVGFRGKEVVNQRIAVAEVGGTDLNLNNVTTAVAWDFTPTEAMDITQLMVYMKKTLSPTGNLTPMIWNNSGGVPGSVLATGDTFDVSTLTTSLVGELLTFTTPATLVGGTLYHVGVQYTGGDATNFVSVDYDNSSGTLDIDQTGWTTTTGLARYRLYREYDLPVQGKSLTPGTNLSLSLTSGQLILDATTAAGGAATLVDLDDTTIVTPGAGDFLRRDGTDWKNATIQTTDIPVGHVTQHESSLTILESQITDAGILARVGVLLDVTSPQVTQHEADLDIIPTQFTRAVDVSEGGTGVTTFAAGAVVSTSGGITNLSTIAPGAAGGYFRSNGSAWVRSLIQPGDITGFGLTDLNDVTIVTPALGHYLRYNGSGWVNLALPEADVTQHEAALSIIPTQFTRAVDASEGGTGLTTWPIAGVVIAPGGINNLTAVAPGAVAGYLRSNGSSWVRSLIQAGDITGFSHSNLSDTTITAPVVGHYLRYDGAGWVNLLLPEADVTQHEAALSIIPTQFTRAVDVSEGGTGVATFSAGAVVSTSGGVTNLSTIAPGAAGGYFRSNGAAWVRSLIQSGDIEEVFVTNHEAALTIAASQVTAGIFPAGVFQMDGLYLIDDSTVKLRMTNNPGTADLSWDTRISVAGLYELRPTTDAGSTVGGTALTIAHATRAASFGGQILAASGSNAAPGISFSADSDTGLYRVSANVIGLVSGADEHLRINPVGAGSPHIAWYQDSLRHGYLQSTAADMRLVQDSPGGNGTVSIMTNGPNARGVFSSTGLAVTGAITVTGNVTSNTSDIRLKDVQGYLDPAKALDAVSNWSTIRYRPNALALGMGMEDEAYVGLIAQEVLVDAPEAVKPAPINPGYVTLQYERLVPHLVASIKALQSRIEELEMN